MREKIKALAEKYGPIKIKCQAKDSLPLDVILDFQGKLKSRSKANLLKLIDRIFALGFVAPFFVWDHDGDYYLFDGHGRLEALCAIREAGVEIPGSLPVVYIEAEDEKKAREILLSITSQYGEFDEAVLSDWLEELHDDIAETLRLVDNEIKIVSLEEESEDSPGTGDVEPILCTCPKCGHQWQE